MPKIKTSQAHKKQIAEQMAKSIIDEIMRVGELYNDKREFRVNEKKLYSVVSGLNLFPLFYSAFPMESFANCRKPRAKRKPKVAAE